MNLLANDYDPNGNVPLTLVSINPSSGSIYASIVSSTSVMFSAAYTGTASFTYTIANSLGATGHRHRHRDRHRQQQCLYRRAARLAPCRSTLNS